MDISWIANIGCARSQFLTAARSSSCLRPSARVSWAIATPTCSSTRTDRCAKSSRVKRKRTTSLPRKSCPILIGLGRLQSLPRDPCSDNLAVELSQTADAYATIIGRRRPESRASQRRMPPARSVQVLPNNARLQLPRRRLIRLLRCRTVRSCTAMRSLQSLTLRCLLVSILSPLTLCR